MRTTIAIEDQLLEEARKRALTLHISLAKYIESALRERLSAEAGESPTPHRPLRTFRGDGVQPGIDLNDSASLLATMDEK
jgi:hypothetical protein